MLSVLVTALQSLEMLFSSFSYAVGNAAVLGTTSVLKQGGLDQGVAPAERLASQVPHFNRAKRGGGAPEGSPFLFCLAGYVTDNLTYLHSHSRSHAGLCIPGKRLSSDFQWLDYQFRNCLKLRFFHENWKYHRDLRGHSRIYLESSLKFTFTWQGSFYKFWFLGEERNKGFFGRLS